MDNTTIRALCDHHAHRNNLLFIEITGGTVTEKWTCANCKQIQGLKDAPEWQKYQDVLDGLTQGSYRVKKTLPKNW